jgi:hypothetical protein
MTAYSAALRPFAANVNFPDFLLTQNAANAALFVLPLDESQSKPSTIESCGTR